jgi:ergothioneine biosynthesis protein EgtB
MLTTATSEQHLAMRLADAREATDALFELVRRDALYERPIAERHRIVFYIGHLEAFDWNLLNTWWIGADAIVPELDKLFAFGIDPLGDGLPTDTPDDWPALDAVFAYRDRTRAAVDAVTAASTTGRPIDTQATPNERRYPLVQLLNVAIEHRLMHAETLAYMLHRLPAEMKIAQFGDDAVREIPRSAQAGPTAEENECAIQGTHRAQGARAFSPDTVDIPAGPAFIGIDRSAGRFGWDNEFDGARYDVPAFRIDRYMVTNGQFAEFIAVDGYRDRRWWRDEDWQWKERAGIKHPAFWLGGEEGSSLRTMFGSVPLPLDWPAYVSYAEASAYARWAGAALPSEAQWQRAATGASDAREAFAQTPPNTGNFDFVRWDPSDVHAPEHPVSPFGVVGMFGNGWEWTSTPFGPLPGFERFEFYKGYSADFFDGLHFVLKGGSPRTAACMLRPSFRNWFQAHYPYAYAGFRCVHN